MTFAVYVGPVLFSRNESWQRFGVEPRFAIEAKGTIMERNTAAEQMCEADQPLAGDGSAHAHWRLTELGHDAAADGSTPAVTAVAIFGGLALFLFFAVAGWIALELLGY